jgi:long-subunit fatty acid transport protein
MLFNVSPPDRIIGAPEQPDYDAQGQIRVGPFVAPTASLGLLGKIGEWVRIGLSARGPMVINSSATLRVRLPTSALFDGSRVVGEAATVRLVMLPIARAGISANLGKLVEVEVAVVREFWSSQSSIEVDARGISLEGLAGGATRIQLDKLSVPRNLRDANSYRLGVEVDATGLPVPLRLRAGVSLNEAAVDRTHLSMSAFDLGSVYAGGGLSVPLGKHVQVDGSFGHYFMPDVRVDPDKAAIGRVSATGGTTAETINGGSYSASANLLTIGAQYRF